MLPDVVGVAISLLWKTKCRVSKTGPMGVILLVFEEPFVALTRVS